MKRSGVWKTSKSGRVSILGKQCRGYWRPLGLAAASPVLAGPQPVHQVAAASIIPGGPLPVQQTAEDATIARVFAEARALEAGAGNKALSQALAQAQMIDSKDGKTG